MPSGPPSNDLVEADPVVRLAARPAALRAIVAMINARGTPLPAATIARMGNFSRETWDDLEDVLHDFELIQRIDTDAEPRYRLRMDTPAVDAFMAFRAWLSGPLESAQESSQPVEHQEIDGW